MRSRREELSERVKGQLHIGQILFYTSNESTGMAAADVVVEKVTIIDIPAAVGTITVKDENGNRRTLDLELTPRKILYLGSISVGLNSSFWVFVSEQQLWDFWEWYIISDRAAAAFVEKNLEGDATEKNLLICRLLYDILVNGNLNYQNMSCAGCINTTPKDSSIQLPCHKCVRHMKALEDQWHGSSSPREWLMNQESGRDQKQ